MADSKENYQLDLGNERVKSMTEITVNLCKLYFKHKHDYLCKFQCSLDLNFQGYLTSTFLFYVSVTHQPSTP